MLAESGVTVPAIPSQTLSDLAGARRTLRTAATNIVGAPVDEIASRVRSQLGQSAPWKPRRSITRYLDLRAQPVRREEAAGDPAPRNRQADHRLSRAPATHWPPSWSDCRPCCSARSRTSLRATWRSDSRNWSARPSRGPQNRPRLDEGLDRQHPEVRDFLRQAATEDGAPWSLLTPVCPALAERPGEHRQPPDRAAPMSSPARDELLAVLDALEESDARNLAWGLTDESWTRDGLAEFLGRHRGGADPQACIDELLAGNLLVQLPREWPARYRTRMSEAVRLFTRLRQTVPRPALAVGRSPGLRLPLPPQAARLPRAEPRTPEGPRATCASRNSPPRSSPRSSASWPGGTCRASSWAPPRRSSPGLQSRTDRGVVVGAGTGSGKTLAFYLPALSQLAAAGAEGPRVIAIYPRNELLKDQLATALREVRGLRSAGSRSLVIGAYFGPTPFHSDLEPDTRAGWRRRGSSWICPFLTCPAVEQRRKLRRRARMGASG